MENDGDQYTAYFIKVYESCAMFVARARAQSNNCKHYHHIKERKCKYRNLNIHVCYVSPCWVRVFSF